MATAQKTMDFLLDQLKLPGQIWSRRMFGEYCVYCRDKTVALVVDDRLFVKMTDAGAAYIGDFAEGFPFPGAKAWLLLSGDMWENSKWLTELIKITTAELPLPKKKKKKLPVKKLSSAPNIDW